MKRLVRTLEQKLSIGVAIGLVVFTLVAGVATAAFAYRQETQANQALQAQLIEVVRAQAEVAVFAENEDIAHGVINGLLATPFILAVRIQALQGFSASGGQTSTFANPGAITHYPLYSPADAATMIGRIDIVTNAQRMTEKALMSGLLLFAVIALQVILAAVLVVWVSRRVIIRPIAELATHIEGIEPGSGIRVAVPEKHQDDEIGQLSRTTNRLIESHERVLAELRELATTDALTGVCNRRQFMRRMNDELARIQRLESSLATVLMLDIDHFKNINDHYGHPAGDAALSQLGTILRSTARRIDVVGRLGGEEFAVLLVGTDIGEAMVFAERLRLTVAETPVVHECHELFMTLSIGVGMLANTDHDADSVLARADKALYEAKAQGRNRVVLASGT
jgi:diguanylate cyclase (GGDEF)-like protein